MSTPQSSSELTTRDVLQQIDHRLGLIEADVRENNTKTETKIDALEAKTETKIDALEVEIREIRREFNGKFNLVICLIITTWLSMMGTLLFKL